MSKVKTLYECTECGSLQPKWSGQCPDCQQWNCLQESTAQRPGVRQVGYAGSKSEIASLKDVTTKAIERMPTGLKELDRVLGGGLVDGSVVLIGGDPGVGKSTILLQTLALLSRQHRVLYVSGEESLQQISLRAKRLGLDAGDIRLLAETQAEAIVQAASQEKPQVVVVDSIQTLHSSHVQSAPGSVSQVRESAAQLVKLAKQKQMAIFLVGHVTKEGALAGPRVLEHMVDCVLYFEGEKDSRYRALRAIKNRFGAVNELGIFAMVENGLREITNPSAIFLKRYQQAVPGSVITAPWEGSRPLLLEVQALVDDSSLGNPRRLAVGLDQNRLAMLLAVLSRHGSVSCHDQDVFVNVVGGVKVMETSADLAILLAILSSLKNRALARELIVFGEVGLSGEIRPVPNGQERLIEAEKHGFKRAIIPLANKPAKLVAGGIQVHAVSHLSEAIECMN